MEKKIIAVAGATGAQGGGLVRAILADPSGGFAVRALTRDPKCDKARALAGKGAEVVAANVDDVESLKKAFRGAHGAYCVTFFWDHFSPDREKAQAHNMALAAKDAGVKHVIWSTFEDTRLSVPLSDDRMPTLQGKYKVPHFDAKAEANHLLHRAGPAGDVPAHVVLLGQPHLLRHGSEEGPRRQAGVHPAHGGQEAPRDRGRDIGGCAYGIFQRGAEFIGKTVGVAGEHLTGAQMAAALSKALGQEVAHNAVTPAVYRCLRVPGRRRPG